jgi:predicted DNA-binding transcriptional regulator AlpA
MTTRTRDKKLAGIDLQPELLTFPATAVVLGCSISFVWGMVIEGKLRAVTLGAKCKRVPRSEIERIVAGGAE